MKVSCFQCGRSGHKGFCPFTAHNELGIIRSDLSLHSCSPCSELETVMDANPEVQRNKGDGVTAAPENNAAGVQVPDNAEVSHSGDFGPWMLAQPRRVRE